MLPDRVSNPGPLTYESGALPIALRGPARLQIRPKIYHLHNGEVRGGVLRPQNKVKEPHRIVSPVNYPRKA